MATDSPMQLGMVGLGRMGAGIVRIFAEGAISAVVAAEVGKREKNFP